jgi:hypothetical protein
MHQMGHFRTFVDCARVDDPTGRIVFVTCLMTVLTSVPFGVRAGRKIVATGVPLAA